MIVRWTDKTSPMLRHYMAMTAILLSETLPNSELDFHLDAMDAAWWRLTQEQREWVSEMSPILTMLQEGTR